MLLIPLIVGLLWFFAPKNTPNVENKISSRRLASGSRTNHPLAFFDKELFYESVTEAKKANNKFGHQISGGIIPHHLFPSFIIADFFSRLSKQSPKTIVLIGPNHYERGKYKVISSLHGWETPSGIVEPEEKIIQDLQKNNLIMIDEENLPKDHAVAGIMPFVNYFLPSTKVVPLLLSGFMTKDEIQLLSTGLKKHVGKDTLVIAAVDFSHYLTNKKAQEKDNLTLELMKSNNYDQLLPLENDHLDSPQSIVTLLILMQHLKAAQMDILYHTNSGILQKNDSIETTSYFSIAYY